MEFTTDTITRSHHIYKYVDAQYIGEILQCKKETITIVFTFFKQLFSRGLYNIQIIETKFLEINFRKVLKFLNIFPSKNFSLYGV